MKVFGIIGWKNNGKTTLTERLVAEITARRITVSTIKHAHHGFDIDAPGKDSYRHRIAGASEVMIGSGKRWALLHELRSEDEPTLATLLAKLSPVDLVLVEGYKHDAHPKIEVRRSDAARDPIAPNDPYVRAVASDMDPDDSGIPWFGLNETAEIANFILKEAGLERYRSELNRSFTASSPEGSPVKTDPVLQPKTETL